MLLKFKEVKLKVKTFHKQINKEAILILNKAVNDYLDSIIGKQKVKRITSENIEL